MLENFNKKMTEHQKLSQTSSAGMFKGGLANHEEKTIKLHTAHHLLLAGLQQIINKDIKQCFLSMIFCAVWLYRVHDSTLSHKDIRYKHSVAIMLNL